MRELVVAVGAILCLLSGSALASEYVHGYMRNNGTYVPGHYRSTPDGSVRNNYSFKGNVNPYTGSTGHNYYRHSRSSPYYRPNPYYRPKPYYKPHYGNRGQSSHSLYGQQRRYWHMGN